MIDPHRILRACAGLALALLAPGCVLFPSGSFEVYDPANLAEFQPSPDTSGRARSSPADDGVRIECPRFLDHAVPQEAADLCWAACAVSVRRYLHLPDAEQAELASSVINLVGDRGAEPTQIMLAICPRQMKKFRKSVLVSVQLEPSASDELVEAIARGSPVLVGLANEPPAEGAHVYVAYAVTCAKRKSIPILGAVLEGPTRKLFGINEWMIKELELFDPDPYGGPVKLDAAEVAERLTFFFDAKMAEARLVEAMKKPTGGKQVKLLDETLGRGKRS